MRCLQLLTDDGICKIIAWTMDRLDYTEVYEESERNLPAKKRDMLFLAFVTFIGGK